jgi:predicted lipoprotein with Yx(FWY)xxD motif
MEMDSSAGKIYTDAKSMALYTYDKDEMGKSNCYDKCATNWPPFLAAADAKAEGDWTLVKRDDGSMQWAYDGKPLYLFIGDKKAGDITGDGKGDVWHVAKADAE